MGQSLKRRRNSRKNKNDSPAAADTTAAANEAAPVAQPTTTEQTLSPTAAAVIEAPKETTTTTTAPKQEEAPQPTATVEEQAPPKQTEEEQAPPVVVEQQPQIQQQQTQEAGKDNEQEKAPTPKQEEKAPTEPVEAVVAPTATTEEKAQEEQKQEEKAQEEEIVAFNGSHTMTVSNHLHKYIVGPKGATIKGIQASSGDEKLKIDLSGDTCVITSTNDDAIRSAIKQIDEVLAPHKDKLNVDAMKESQDFKVPSNLHKYILGDKGSQLKSIQTETRSNLTLNTEQNTITIKSMTREGVEQAFKLVLQALEKVWWYYDASTETFTENTLTDRLFKQYRTKVNEQHELMSECYEKAKVAFDEGRKDEAKELSEQGKKHKELKEQYSQEAAEAIFAEMNKDKGEDTIDLHGLLVAEALDFVEKRIQKLTESKSIQVLNVITGAGNHSEAEAKIKPMIAKMLDEKSLKYEKGNEGTFIVTLF